MKRVAFVGLLTLAGASLLACSAVLGFDPLTLRPTDDAGGSTNGPGGQDGSTSGSDASSDAPSEAATCTNVDFQTDPAHCGRCNHTCAGGTCEGGACTAVRLADGLAYPEGLVVDETSVYVAENDLHRILKFGKNALGPCTTVPQPSECVLIQDPASVFLPSGMGIDATHVYWANGGGSADAEVRSCPRTGCGGQAALRVATLGEAAFHHFRGPDILLPLDLPIRDGRIFWAENFAGAIRSRQVDGGGAIVTHLDNLSFSPVQVVVDETNIYFTDDTVQHPTRIQSVPREGSVPDGGSLKVIADTNAVPFGIALSAANNLYWTVPFESQEGDGIVGSVAKTADGGAPVGSVAGSMVEPSALIVDATNVYWLISGSQATATGLVVYCPLTGCPASGPIVLARQQRWPRHLTQDSTAIYWSNEGVTSSAAYDGQVWKIAKP